MEATHCPCRGEGLTKAGVMRKLAGTIHAAARRHYSNYKYSHSCLAVDSKPEDHHGCISHRCAISSTTPDQQQIATSSKNPATTQQQVDTRPLRTRYLKVSKIMDLTEEKNAHCFYFKTVTCQFW